MSKKAPIKNSEQSLEDKAYFWFGVVLILPVIIAFLYGEPWRDRGCYLNENDLFYQEFGGIVKEKYINKEWGARRAKIVKMKNEISYQLINGDYYQKIEVGDSIYKAKESFILAIYKPNEIVELEYKYACNE